MKRGARTAGRTTLIAAACVFLLPSVAQANAGIPMLAITWPVAWVSFLPVVAVESWIAKRLLGIAWPRSLRVAALANAASTVLGIPITWAILTTAEMGAFWAMHSAHVEAEVPRVVIGALSVPWLGSTRDDGYWQVPLAAALLCIPFALTSAVVEELVARWRLADVPRSLVRRWAWVANLATYGFLFVAALTWLAVNVMRGSF